MNKMLLQGTTASDGSVTITGERTISGLLVAVQWIDGDLADGVDAVLSTINSPAAATLLTLTNANNDALYYPRVVAHSNVGAAQTAVDQFQLIEGLPKLAITNGGGAKTGGCVIYWLE